jgi:hypothetical protein
MIDSSFLPSSLLSSRTYTFSRRLSAWPDPIARVVDATPPTIYRSINAMAEHYVKS